MTFEKYRSEVERLKALSDVVIQQLPDSLSATTKIRQIKK